MPLALADPHDSPEPAVPESADPFLHYSVAQKHLVTQLLAWQRSHGVSMAVVARRLHFEYRTVLGFVEGTYPCPKLLERRVSALLQDIPIRYVRGSLPQFRKGESPNNTYDNYEEEHIELAQRIRQSYESISASWGEIARMLKIDKRRLQGYVNGSEERPANVYRQIVDKISKLDNRTPNSFSSEKPCKI